MRTLFLVAISVAASLPLSAAEPPQLTESAAPALTANRETAAVKAARLAMPAAIRLTIQREMRVSHGTAVVIHPSGYLLTAGHVVALAPRILATTSPGESHDARLVARDLEDDVALLKIEVPLPLTAIVWGRSGQLQPAETVLAVGNSFGRGNIVTQGIVNATDAAAKLPGGEQFVGLIQTDASLHSGMSGGPLVNLDGDLVGLALFVRADEADIAYALPTDRIRAKVARWLKADAATGK